MWILLNQDLLEKSELQGSARARPIHVSLAFLHSTTGFICRKYLAYARPIDFKFIQFISMIHFHGRWIFNKLKIVKLYRQPSVHLVLFVFVFFSSHLSRQNLGCHFPALYLLAFLHSQLKLFPILLFWRLIRLLLCVKLCSLFSVIRWDSWIYSKTRFLLKSCLCGCATM